MSSQAVITALNGVLADATVFYYKLHNFHWNVRGPGFFTLHDVFEKLYTEWAGVMDEVAERIKSLGGDPLPSLAACLQTAKIIEVTDHMDANKMVESAVADIHLQRARMNETIDLAQKANDRTTENLLDAFIDASAKHVWMLSAYLGKSAVED